MPEIASRKHIEAIYALADKALQDAALTRADIDAVAVTYAPGLIGAVLVGVNFAKAAALARMILKFALHLTKSKNNLQQPSPWVMTWHLPKLLKMLR